MSCSARPSFGLLAEEPGSKSDRLDCTVCCAFQVFDWKLSYMVA